MNTTSLTTLFTKPLLLFSLAVPSFSPDEIQAITTLIEKQAQIVVKPKEVSKEETLHKAALLAQYAEVTDEEEYLFWVLEMLKSYWEYSVVDQLFL